jgi:hypothetical protein
VDVTVPDGPTPLASASDPSSATACVGVRS